ncbi:MAG: carboxypeptidase regulatory-like domain-containing protein, partial [Candidatus Eisenbacteria bacterium]|nr:carboxypeptidase regulatory-like domain-containing protein [Candidatus Eisenbacteria bacterium]
NQTILTPPGGSGDIIGTVAFSGITSPPFPQARILAVGTGAADEVCVSAFGAIAILGTFNDFDTGRVPEFLLEEVTPCFWVGTVELEEGLAEFKFVTGADDASITFDSPPDYGNLGPNNGDDPLEGDADGNAGGPDGNISVTIPSAGMWTFVLNEATVPATYRITQEELFIRTDPQTGEFMVEDVSAGTYELSFEAEGYLGTEVNNVSVVANQVTDIGTVNMSVASGSLNGVVVFSDNPFNPPEAIVAISLQGAPGVTARDTTMGAYTFTGLASGTYDISASAPGYISNSLSGVMYVNGQDITVGDLVLDPGCQSTFATIQLAGDFNAFNLDNAPFMTQMGCVWTDTLSLTTGTYNLKFVTDGAFDNPMDYGGDETPLSVPGTYATSLISGIGTAITISVLADGDYEFILDEVVPEFTVNLLGGGSLDGGLTGSVSFEGVSSAPLPAASCQLFPSGSLTPLTTVQSDTDTGTFSFMSLPAGTYDVSVTSSCFDVVMKSGFVVGSTTVDAGDFALTGAPSAFATIQMVGQFTDPAFDVSISPAMTQTSDCVWELEIDLLAQSYLFKFVTDGEFDSPPDYGGMESETLTLPGTFAVSEASGEGSALNIEVPMAGRYKFVLNEAQGQFTATEVN